jgi:phage-related protein
MAEAMMGGFGGSIEKLKSSLDVLMTSLGSIIADYLTPVIAKVQEWLDKFNAMSDSEKDQVVRIAAIAAAVGPLLMGLGKVISIVGKVMQFAPQLATALQGVSGVFGGVGASAGAALAPIAAVAAAIGVLVAAFMNLWNNNEQFKTNMTGTWESIKESFSGFISQIQERLPKIQEAFSNVVEAIKPIWDGFCALLAPIFEGAFQNIALVLQTMFNFIISIIDMLTGILTGDKELFLQGLNEFLTTIQTFITTYLTLLWTTIVNIINVILGFFGTSLTQLKTVILTAFTTIVTSITNKMIEFKDMVIEKFTEVCDFELSCFVRYGTFGCSYHEDGGVGNILFCVFLNNMS